MLLGGLWHGASWTFVVWGALHGFGLAITRVLPARTRGSATRLVVAACARLACVGLAVHATLLARARDVVAARARVAVR